MARIAGYGIKVQTDTGHFVWLTETATSASASKAMRFDSEAGATMYRNQLSASNPHVTLTVEKLSK